MISLTLGETPEPRLLVLYCAKCKAIVPVGRETYTKTGYCVCEKCAPTLPSSSLSK